MPSQLDPYLIIEQCSWFGFATLGDTLKSGLPLGV